MRAVVVFLLVSTAASAQHIHFGVKGGVPLDDAYAVVSAGAGNFVRESARFDIGPMLDITLPAGLGVEFDILYKRRTLDVSSIAQSSSGRIWEFPLVGKYRFVKGPITPYAGAGIAFRSLGEFKELATGNTRGSSNTGVVLEGGVEAKFILRFSAELRYTRWTGQSLSDLAHSPGSVLQTTQNQAEFLVGITF